MIGFTEKSINLDRDPTLGLGFPCEIGFIGVWDSGPTTFIYRKTGKLHYQWTLVDSWDSAASDETAEVISDEKLTHSRKPFASSNLENESDVDGANVTEALNWLKNNSGGASVVSKMVYIDLLGNDLTGDGTSGKPFASLFKAMESIIDASPTNRYVIKYGVGFFTETQNIVHKPNVWVIGENVYATRVIFSGTYSLDPSFSGALDNRFGFENIFIDGVLNIDMSIVTASHSRMYNRNCQFNKAITFKAFAATSRFYLFDCETFSTTSIMGGYFHSLTSVFNGLVTLASLANTSCNHIFSNSYLPNGLTINNPLTTEYIDVWLYNSQIRSMLTANGYSGLHYSFGCLPVQASRAIDSTVVIGALGNEAMINMIYARRVVNTATTYANNTDNILAVDTSAVRTIFLPPASMMKDGDRLLIKDETGNAGTNNITINRSSTDTIEGLTSKVINTNYGVLEFYKAGTGKFALITPSSSAPASPIYYANSSATFNAGLVALRALGGGILQCVGPDISVALSQNYDISNITIRGSTNNVSMTKLTFTNANYMYGSSYKVEQLGLDPYLANAIFKNNGASTTFITISKLQHRGMPTENSFDFADGAVYLWADQIISANIKGALNTVTYAYNGSTVSHKSNNGSAYVDSSSTVVGATTTTLQSLASRESYTPTLSANWVAPAPTTVQEALDRMSTLLVTLNSANPIP